MSTKSEREVEQALLGDPDVAIGVAAPYEPSAELDYADLFSLPWSLIAPPRHPLLRIKSLALADLADAPLILFERGSTGRQHVVDAFHERDLSPRVEMETTNTQIIVRMVAAGLGVSIVPLLADGRVTRGHRVGVRSLDGQIRPIHSGILKRRGDQLSAAARKFIEFIHAETARFKA